MEAIYYLLINLAVIIILLGPIALVVIVFKPSLLTKFTKQAYARKKIALYGLAAGISAVFMLSVLGAVFEPESARLQRLADEKANAAQTSETDAATQVHPRLMSKQVTESAVVPYRTIENEDATVSKGETKTVTEGVNGERVKTYRVYYKNGIETNRVLVSDEVTKPATDEVIAIGTYVAPTPTTQSVQTSPPVASPNVYYANCTTARNAGVTPIYVGQPGYRSALDRDDDGIACE